ncbi:flagellar biosynthetic protein FliO [Rhodocyclus gracilis]|uniref:flagellar biosynthetic protein FliO n=1 Tax=Rhodocyclus gracilis TaxID=2929842 RepID=UPI001ADB3D91|nr:flagellar biosynthetic protein FliO [Rhodocyclus gracilis]
MRSLTRFAAFAPALCGVLLTRPALADPATAANAVAAASPGVPTLAIVQTILGLAVVIALLFLVAYVLRRFNGGRGIGGNGPVRLVGGMMLGTRERVVVLEVADTWIVVGMAPGQMRTLHTLPRGELPADANSSTDFASRLAQMIGRKP